MKYILGIFMVIIGFIIMLILTTYSYVILIPILWFSKKLLGKSPGNLKGNILASICLFFTRIKDFLSYLSIKTSAWAIRFFKRSKISR